MAWTIDPAGPLRFAGYVGRTPVKVVATNPTLGRWLHVHVLLDDAQGSISVSVSEDAARYGLGQPVLPDESLEINAATIYLAGPKDRPDGRGAVAVVEQRTGASVHSRSLRGALNAITSTKATLRGIPMTPGQWYKPWTNILGNVAGMVRVEGVGTVWMSTHINTSAPPPPSNEAMKTSAGAFPIRASDGIVPIIGNPAMVYYTLDDGMVLYLSKIEGGRQYGEFGPVLPT